MSRISRWIHLYLCWWSTESLIPRVKAKTIPGVFSARQAPCVPLRLC
jgi:hypothetical protein